MEHSRKLANIRFFIIVGILVAAIVALIVFIAYRGSEAITERDVMQFSMNTDAVVIRDETVLSAEEYARIDYFVGEGQTVAQGDIIAATYKVGFSDEMLQAMIAAREEVYDAQIAALGSVKDTVLEDLNAQILAARDQILQCVMCDSGEDLLTLQLHLETKLEERMEYLRSKVQATDELAALYVEVENMEQQISAWVTDVYSDESGSVSFYFDGFEQAMNMEKLDMLTPDLINRALEGNSATTWTTDDKNRVARIIDSGHWYIAFLTDASNPVRLAEGLEYTVTMDGYGAFNGVALEPVVRGKSVINTIEFNSDMGALTDVRIVSIDISASIAGISVSEKAIRMQDGLTYLELMFSKSNRLIQVDVMYLSDGYVLVRPHNDEDTLGEGVRYWIP